MYQCMRTNRRGMDFFPSHVLVYFSVYSENCSVLYFPLQVNSILPNPTVFSVYKHAMYIQLYCIYNYHMT